MILFQTKQDQQNIIFITCVYDQEIFITVKIEFMFKALLVKNVLSYGRIYRTERVIE